MTEDTRSSLKELQKIDSDIREARIKVDGFAEVLEEIDEPATQLEDEVEATRKRLREIKLEERRLELAADEKRARSKRLQDRMSSVRNLREEAAVHAELDLVRRAVEGDEQEALGLLDQIRKLEERLTDLEETLEAERAEAGPRREQILEERSEAESHLERLLSERDDLADQIDDKERRLYENIKAGGRAVVVAELTADGACGHCFGMVPLQVQANIRAETGVIRCEACGVILTPAPEDDDE